MMNHPYKNLEQIENDYTHELSERGFAMYRGWDDELAANIVRSSQQPHIVESTPNDMGRRFRDHDAARVWHSQGNRSVYTLYGEELAGLIWYDERPRLDVSADHTFAIRLYEEARGKKLAYGFMKAAHHDFAEREANPTVWLDVAVDNPAARHLYEKFGYVTAHHESDRIVMVYRSNS